MNRPAKTPLRPHPGSVPVFRDLAPDNTLLASCLDGISALFRRRGVFRVSHCNHSDMLFRRFLTLTALFFPC